MLSDLQEDRTILHQINSNLLFYRLCSIDPSAAARFNEAYEGLRSLPDFDKEYEGFEGTINAAFDALQMNNGKPSKNNAEGQLIIDLARAAVYDFGMLDVGIDTLQELKERILRHHVETVMSWAKACLAPLPNAYRNLLGSVDADAAFPRNGNDNDPQQKSEVVAGLDKMLQCISPERLPEYLGNVKKVLFDFNDLRRGAQKLEDLERALFEWCITPSISFADNLNIEDFNQDKSDYARLLLQMEELEFRLGFMQKRWESVLLHVSGDDSNEEREGLKKALEERRAELGSPDLIGEMRVGRKSLVNILKQIALLGPVHMGMARSYAGIFAREIENRVFGLGRRVQEYEESDRCIIVTEPRQLRKYGKDQMTKFGFSATDLAAFGDTAYGILSGYTIHTIPPKKCPAEYPLPQEIEKMRGELYVTRRIHVIDFYADRGGVPDGLLPAFDRKETDRELSHDELVRTDPVLAALLENVGLPRGSGQVRIDYDVIFTRDLAIEKKTKLCKLVDGELIPAYRHTPRRGAEMVHSIADRLLSESAYSSKMLREQFVQMVSRHSKV